MMALAMMMENEILPLGNHHVEILLSLGRKVLSSLLFMQESLFVECFFLIFRKGSILFKFLEDLILLFCWRLAKSIACKGLIFRTVPSSSFSLFLIVAMIVIPPLFLWKIDIEHEDLFS